MSSPPSLDSLNISAPPLTKSNGIKSPSSDSTPTDEKSEPIANGNGTHHTDGDGDAQTATTSTTNGTSSSTTDPASKTAPTDVKEDTPAAAPPAMRPSPNIPGQSAPAVPGRVPGQPLRSGPGLQGPMGMRGRGGMPQMPTRLPPSLQAKMDKVAASRSGAPAPSPTGVGPNPNATSMSALLRSQALRGGQGGGGGGGGGGSGGGNAIPAPRLPGPASGPLSSLAARRAAGGRPNLGTMGMGASSPAGIGGRGGMAGRRMGPPGGLTLSDMAGGGAKDEGNKFTDFGKIMDPSGSLRFSSKAVLTAKGVEFADGASFKINMDEMEIVGELGKGNYGSVQQVYHRPMGIMMAMKEIRLELDESKLNGIIMELDILHRAVAPEIVEFYGAFTIESCVYYCMELMDAGSLDTLTGGGVPAKMVKDGDESEEMRVPEPVLRRITAGIVRGLKFLKDELQIMHRDVKPTNVLINKKGEVKLVDFGVSGQLEKSLAKTNIGCQSYMAPERIKGESQNQPSTYTVSSDVWSVGLSIIELAKGCYPYPPETFANVFAQLTAIVHGPAPTLPKGYSADAQDFVAQCLIKDANSRPTYAQLLEHPFLLADKDADVDMAGWVADALERRAARGVIPLQTIEA